MRPAAGLLTIRPPTHVFKGERMKAATAMVMAAVCVGLAASAARADNLNRCLGKSTGLGGYQFKNNCGIPIRAFMRAGGLNGAMGHGSFRALTLRAGEMKVVSGYSEPVIACPVTYEGKDVTINPDTRDCIVRN
jgi:hypothetical protein